MFPRFDWLLSDHCPISIIYPAELSHERIFTAMIAAIFFSTEWSRLLSIRASTITHPSLLYSPPARQWHTSLPWHTITTLFSSHVRSPHWVIWSFSSFKTAWGGYCGWKSWWISETRKTYVHSLLIRDPVARSLPHDFPSQSIQRSGGVSTILDTHPLKLFSPSGE